MYIGSYSNQMLDLFFLYLRIQGDLDGRMNLTDSLDDTKVYNQTGLVSSF